MLRRVTDVLLTLVPLLLAGLVTLELTVLIHMPLNFANIIALPLLLGLGVAFKIYFVMAWRAGTANLLQSSLTRAVFFSAMTTATAFGSLWLSHHPGTSSMGKLLALSLVTDALRRRALPAGADGAAAQSTVKSRTEAHRRDERCQPRRRATGSGASPILSSARDLLTRAGD